MDLSDSPPGPSSKRLKRDTIVENVDSVDNEIGEELDGDHCSICLQLLLDRTVIPECSHEFCFECIVTWTEQSRRCPLCTRTIGPYLIHNIRSNFDYQKYHLPPLRSSPPPIQPLRRVGRSLIHRIPGRERRWGRRARREQDVADELERAVDRRRWIYHNHLYAKHVGSNMLSRYRPFPTPAQFALSQDYISRATIFIRRELRVWANLDVEFLTAFILSLMKAIDIRSESAIKLLAEFLDMDRPYSAGCHFPNAEHFAHELYSFLRSPYKSLSAYDVNVQYDEPEGVYRHANRDSETASDRRIINEVLSPVDSRTHHRSRERLLRLNDGGDRSRPELNVQGADHKLDRGTRGSPTSHTDKQVTRNEADSSALLNSTSANEAEKPIPAHMAGEDAPDPESADSNGSRPRPTGKGKQRTSHLDLTTLVSNGHGHMHEGVLGSRSDHDGEVEDGQATGNASVGGDGFDTTSQADDDKLPSYQSSSRFNVPPLRTRNPLLIAQAHLLESREKRKLRNKDISLDLRQSSPNSSERLSLLSRITDPNLPVAQINKTATGLTGPSLETTEMSLGIKGQDFRAKLLQRLEVEHAAQAERDKNAGDVNDSSSSLTSQGTSSSPFTALSNSIRKDVSGPVETRERADHEMRARARARLRMKLTVAKHLNASNAQIDNADDRTPRTPEEKAGMPVNREGMLRAVLENRRKSG